ncbi:hypothetical protein Tco_0856725 [Tanacetum coccineum]|uniref:Uncharacterized protein n=1 Tax=Tanacetum coccineum TaxID=301880 RepID=A0ABQ5B588_9ASTR
MEHRKDVRDDGSLKVSNSSHLVSPTATINMPRGLYNVDVAATFGVPLTTVGDLYLLIKSIKAGKHDELLSRMTNDERMAIMDALGTICNSIKADNTNVDVIPCAGASAKDQPKVNSNFRLLVADLVFDGVNISIPRKVVKKGRSSFARCLIEVNSEVDLVDVVTIGIPSLTRDDFIKKTFCVDPPIVATSNVVTPTIEKTSDGFQTVGKKKKRKGKSKSTNGGQFASSSVKPNVRYEPKANTSAPKKGATNKVMCRCVGVIIVSSFTIYFMPTIPKINTLTGSVPGQMEFHGLEVGSIRRIQGIGYGVLEFLRVWTTLDIFQNLHILYFQYGVLVFSGYGVLSLFPSWSLVSAGTDTPYLP